MTSAPIIENSIKTVATNKQDDHLLLLLSVGVSMPWPSDNCKWGFFVSRGSKVWCCIFSLLQWRLKLIIQMSIRGQGSLVRFPATSLVWSDERRLCWLHTLLVTLFACKSLIDFTFDRVILNSFRQLKSGGSAVRSKAKQPDYLPPK